MAGGSSVPFNLDDLPNDGASLAFTTSDAPEFYTKTPANVKGDYLEVHHPNIAVPPNLSRRKRASRTSETSASPANKRLKLSESFLSAASTPRKTRNRDPTKKVNPQKNIPRCIDDCDPADQTLINMRDAGEDWPEIRKKYAEMTGQDTAHSTLPNRYSRLKSNFTVLREQDNGLLLIAKQQVEASFEEQKWELVATAVRENGGEQYSGIVLKRQYKKLMLGQGVAPPPGVRDADFEGQDEDVDVNVDADADDEG